MGRIKTDEEAAKLLNKFDKVCTNWVRNQYGIEKTVKFQINPRLHTTLGEFTYNFGRKNKAASRLFVSQDLLLYYDEKTILNVMKHECIHYALYALDLPFDDNDEQFIYECQKHRVAQTENFSARHWYLYDCGKGCTISSATKLHSRFICTKHRRLLKLVKEVKGRDLK